MQRRGDLFRMRFPEMLLMSLYKGGEERPDRALALFQGYYPVKPTDVNTMGLFLGLVCMGPTGRSVVDGKVTPSQAFWGSGFVQPNGVANYLGALNDLRSYGLPDTLASGVLYASRRANGEGIHWCFQDPDGSGKCFNDPPGYRPPQRSW